jgi:phage-related protein
MKWEIKFHRSVKEQILAMPPKVQARFIRLLELMEKHGPNLGTPHTNTSPHR